MTPLQAVRKVGLGDTAVDLIRQIIEKHDAAIVEESAQQIAALRKECDALRAEAERLRALLREAQKWIGDNDDEESLLRLIDAALAGEKTC